MTDDDASATADAMIWAELRDLPMHGVSGKLSQCVRRIKSGVTAARVDLTPVRETPSVALFDARNAWGQLSGSRAMTAAIAKAKTQGIGLAIVRESSSAAAMGYYTTLAIRERMIGVAITNGPPLIFDSALSLISTGEIHTAQERGLQLAQGLMLDKRGQPTTDPETALDGLYVPIGGHRGFGLALMWEVLTGVLSGAEFTGPNVGAPDVYDRRQGVSHTFIAIDPSVAMPSETFTSRVDDLIDQVHASPPAEGVSAILVPGERGQRISEQRARDGIPIAPKRLAALHTLAEEMGVEW